MLARPPDGMTTRDRHLHVSFAPESRHRSFVCTSICRVGGQYVVSRQRTPDTLERKFANGLDCDSILDRHQDTRADEDLTGLGLIAKPRCDIGYRSDGSIIETSFKPDGAKSGKAVRYADAEANVVSQPTPLIGQRSDTVNAFRAPSAPLGGRGFLLERDR
jgi:hypothetical protein